MLVVVLVSDFCCVKVFDDSVSSVWTVVYGRVWCLECVYGGVLSVCMVVY